MAAKNRRIEQSRTHADKIRFRLGWNRRMCGRFVLFTPTHQLAALCGYRERVGGMVPRYNIAPSQPVLNFERRLGGHAFESFCWGFVPSWAPDRSRPHINARSERVANAPAFRQAFARHRSLIFADGFYEWRRGDKQPFFVHRADRQPMALAGIFEDWGEGEKRYTGCAILTTAANRTLQPVHDRMPVVLEPEHWETWLDPALRDPRSLLPLLAPMPDELTALYPISRAVNDPKNDSPQLLQPLAG